MFAIQKSNEDAAEETYCHYCNSWKDNEEWTYFEIVVNDTKEVRIYEDGSDPDNSDYEIGHKPEDDPIDTWECPNCYSQVRELNREPRGENEVWLCGACGEVHTTEDYAEPKESAKSCCSDVEGVKPNPAVFAQAK